MAQPKSKAATRKKPTQNGEAESTDWEEVAKQLAVRVQQLESRVAYLQKAHSGAKLQLEGLIGMLSAGDGTPSG